MICERYETIIVPFPFTEIAVLKRRPALVLSAPDFNRSNDATVIAMITTAKASHWPSDVVLQDLQTAGLRAASVVRWRQMTLQNDMLVRRLGNLATADRLACEHQMSLLFH